MKHLPRHVRIKDDTFYTVKYRKNMPTEDCRGYCDGDEREIAILQGMDERERVKTLIHELLHAIEFSYKLKIPHKLIYALEEPLTYLLTENTKLRWVKWRWE